MALLLVRMAVPVLALYVVWRCFTSFKKGQRRKDPVIMLVDHESRVKYPILYWENSIGRSKSCDIILPDPAVSRDHAVLMRREEGWILCDTDSKDGVYVGAKKVDKKVMGIGDEMTVGHTTLTLMRAEISENKRRRLFQGFSKVAASPFKLMLTVTLVHLLLTLQLFFAGGTQLSLFPLLPFGVLTAAGWAVFAISVGAMRRVSFEMETIALLLSGIGVLLMAGYNPEGLKTQLSAMLLGIGLFFFLIWFMGDLDRVQRFRLWIGAGAIGLFALNMVIGTAKFGSKNWIQLGPVSIQPSEIIKLAFIMFGASTLDKLQTKKNITEFLIFTGICMGFLFLMKDFGTALIFFACFLIIAFMRSGSIRTIALVLTGAVLGVILILRFMPHVADRFSNWGHIWESPNDGGFQQTRMLTYFASGGLFGVGLGQGYLHFIGAAESDLIFGVLSEEQGLLLALVVVCAIAMFTLYARSDVTRSRSTFFSIVSCAAAGMLLFQTCLHVFGSTDIVPLTGVTLPFVSLGGTSMLSCWGMLAFLKASDERTYAAKRMSRRQVRQEQEQEALRLKLMEEERRARRKQEGIARRHAAAGRVAWAPGQDMPRQGQSPARQTDRAAGKPAAAGAPTRSTQQKGKKGKKGKK